MDMRDIEQLHAQYAQPPLTIDISPGVAATAPHLGYSGNSTAPAKASTSPFPFPLRGNPRLLWGLGFVAAAALMFAIGASIGKRELRASNEPVQPLQSASEASARAASGDGHEWPPKGRVSASEPAQGPVLPVAEAAAMPASAASAVAVPAEQPRERSPAEPRAETVKRSAAPPAPAPTPAPAPARAAAAPAPAKTAQQLPTSAAPARNTAAQHASSPTDIKMF